jgi:hypothetical protein
MAEATPETAHVAPLRRTTVFITTEQKIALDAEATRLKAGQPVRDDELNINRSYVIRKLINECLIG